MLPLKTLINGFKRFIPRSVKRGVKRALLNIGQSILYIVFRGQPEKRDVRHIVFVCKGNICRSAFAEYYLRAQISKRTIKIESCGLDVDQGTASPAEAVMVGREFGVALDTHQAKGLKACSMQTADLIVPMEYIQYKRLLSMYPERKGRIRLLSEFSPWPKKILCNIDDPFELGEGEFRRCFNAMQLALDKLKSDLAVPQ